MCGTTDSSFQFSSTLNNTGICKFSNRLITFELNRNGGFEFESNLKAWQVPIKHSSKLLTLFSTNTRVTLNNSSPLMNSEFIKLKIKLNLLNY